MPIVKATHHSFTKAQVTDALYEYLAGDPYEKDQDKNMHRASAMSVCTHELGINKGNYEKYFSAEMNSNSASMLMQKLTKEFGLHGKLGGFYQDRLDKLRLYTYVEKYWKYGCTNEKTMCQELGLNYDSFLEAVKASKRKRSGNSSGQSRVTSQPKTYDEYDDRIYEEESERRTSGRTLFQSRPRIREEKPEKEEWERMRRNFRKSVSDYQRSRRERRAYEAYVDQPEEDTLEYRLSQFFAAGIFMLIVLAIAKHLPVIKEATADVHGLIPMIAWSYELTGFYGGIIYLIYRGFKHRLGGRKALFDIGLMFFGLGCGGIRDGSFVSAVILIAIGCGLFYASR